MVIFLANSSFTRGFVAVSAQLPRLEETLALRDERVAELQSKAGDP
jgi:hypothetical protein